MAKTVIGLFDHLGEARRAVEDLVDSGFDRSEISLVANASDEEYSRYFDKEGRYDQDLMEVQGGTHAGEGAAAGAGIGATVGGIAGLLLGLGLLAVPGVGPLLAAGPIVSALAGIGIGGAAGGLIGALAGAGVPEEEAAVYTEGVRRGGTLVTVQAADERAAAAADILNRHAAVDIEERAAMWRERGWEGYDREAEPYTARQIARERGELEIPVVEEEARIGKREVERGGVRIRSYVTEKPFEENVRLRDETIHVDRRPANRAAGETDMNAFQEGEYQLTETDEEAVVEKRPRVVEDVVVGKDVEEREETVRGTVRRSDVEIQDMDMDQDAVPDFDRYEPDFRRHFANSAGANRYTYDQARPAYRYGYGLASSDRYRGRSWDDIESEIRRDWEARNEGTWEDFREPVRRSWDEARRRL